MRSVALQNLACPEVRRVVGASLALIGAGVLLICLAGCNTFKGVGRDIEAVAQNGQDIIDGKR